MRLFTFLLFFFFTLSIYGQVKPKERVNPAYFSHRSSSFIHSSSSRTQSTVTKLSRIDLYESSELGGIEWLFNSKYNFDYPDDTSLQYIGTTDKDEVLENVTIEYIDPFTLIYYDDTDKTRDVFKLNDKQQVIEGTFEYWDDETEEWKPYRTTIKYKYDALGNRIEINYIEGVFGEDRGYQENIKEMKYEDSRLIEIVYSVSTDTKTRVASDKVLLEYSAEGYLINEKSYWMTDGEIERLSGEIDYLYPHNSVVIIAYRYDVYTEIKETISISTYELDIEKPFTGVGEHFHDAHYYFFYNGPVDNFQFDFEYQVISFTKEHYNDLSWMKNVRRVYTYDEFDLEPDNVTAVDSERFSKVLKVYPNPASDYVIFEGISNTTLSLTNLIGISFEISVLNGKADLSNLPKGIYVINVEGQGTVKIIKQ
ncbi:T9SS type A sorting domain-containing protein [Flammeovirga aprica]|uniref:T9SS type A sorting domain-containing protein n=1 Tax=Flammeovirga aprica JL-4 TaxID=694437 RepID=A0A7X9NYP1_9BACT|nr:T9SS type A sorting domain-containing protein [Flammeovirga aprica]NME66351.1 T9SS type A sorting domain-containing protein [Flammeovirga aprica JL-4]